MKLSNFPAYFSAEQIEFTMVSTCYLCSTFLYKRNLKMFLALTLIFKLRMIVCI